MPHLPKAFPCLVVDSQSFPKTRVTSEGAYFLDNESTNHWHLVSPVISSKEGIVCCGVLSCSGVRYN